MRVLITRPREKADSFAETLIRAGMEPVFFPTIQRSSVKDPAQLDRALRQLEMFSWMIFTSDHAVRAVWERLVILKVAVPSHLKVAAVGPKTAEALQIYGFPSHLVPKTYTTEAIVPGLGNLRGLHVLLPLADIANNALPKAIQAAGGTADVVTVYHTLPADPDPDGLAALRAGVDVITFTSGSTARHFATLTTREGMNPFNLPGSPQIACIGPKTAAVAREIGFQVDVVAEEYTVEGLARVLSSLMV